MSKPVLHIADVLRWADAHLDRTGEWPETTSGELFDAPNEKWANIDQALRKSFRGFVGGADKAVLNFLQCLIRECGSSTALAFRPRAKCLRWTRRGARISARGDIGSSIISDSEGQKHAPFSLTFAQREAATATL